MVVRTDRWQLLIGIRRNYCTYGVQHLIDAQPATASRKSNCLTCVASGALLVGHALDAVTQGSLARHWHADWEEIEVCIQYIS